MKQELAITLTQLVESLRPPQEAGLSVTEAEIEIPLEVDNRTHGDALVFYGSPPHSRWRAGFLPEIHTCRLRVVLDETGEARGGW